MGQYLQLIQKSPAAISRSLSDVVVRMCGIADASAARETDAQSTHAALCQVSDCRILRAEIDCGFQPFFTAMIAAFLLLLLQNRRRVADISCSDRKMSQRPEEREMPDRRVADADVSCIKLTKNLRIIIIPPYPLQEPEANSKEQASVAAPAERKESEMLTNASPADDSATVPCPETPDREGEKQVTNESQIVKPSEVVVGKPGVRYLQACLTV